uniref:Complement factor properdin n=1 Tax=Amphilophus citrinellus TaxID=61819 RepID=A0A3Q0SYC7_AMPCI
PWIAWTPCSVTCGGVGVRSRKRVCSSPPECRMACSGPSEETERCAAHSTCPEDGNWGAWAPFGQCSVSCGVGLQLSLRMCDSPTPKYGGKLCDGPSTRSTICQSPCPVDGFWSGWSSWGECSESCISQGRAVRRTRQRSCSNPAPSSNPPGQDCQGHSHQTENCDHLPFCPVDGGWGSWSPFSSCPVTCGVGLQVSVRRCDSPATQHGGRPCPGEGRQTRICSTKVHCPVDGVWSEWSEWKQCKFPGGRNIRCKKTAGSHLRSRHCLHRAHNGTICIGDNLTEMQVCYDIEGCDLKGRRDPWTSWSLCEPPCGKNSIRSRKKICNLYPPRATGKASFYGTPKVDCGPLADGEQLEQSQPCMNVPACT